jgi:hypothetical protein
VGVEARSSGVYGKRWKADHSSAHDEVTDEWSCNSTTSAWRGQGETWPYTSSAAQLHCELRAVYKVYVWMFLVSEQSRALSILTCFCTEAYICREKLNFVSQHVSCNHISSGYFLYFMFCWPCFSKCACDEAKLMHYLSSLYWVTRPLHVSGLLIAHHQEEAMYICDNWYVLYVVVY